MRLHVSTALKALLNCIMLQRVYKDQCRRSCGCRVCSRIL